MGDLAGLEYADLPDEYRRIWPTLERFERARDISCTTKRVYPSKAQAKKHLKQLHRMGRRALVIYECWFCELHHIGHLPGEQTYKRPGRPFG